MFFDAGEGKEYKDKLANWRTAMDGNKSHLNINSITVLAHFNLPKEKAII
jgi:hypothetical protein